jgi:hypothetical protein
MNAKIDAKVQDLYEKGIAQLSNVYKETTNAMKDLNQEITEEASDLYKAGKKNISHLEDEIVEYSAKLVKTIKHRPIASALVIAGVSYFIYQMFKK